MNLHERLKKAGIRHFDELIHDQSKSWLLKNFSHGADEYPVNVSRLMRNIIWQSRERVLKKEKPPLTVLIRTFWYIYIKPTLSRAGALAQQTDQYKQLVDQLVAMVKEFQVMRYGDIGFRDDKQLNRKVGKNANIVIFSEKVGLSSFLNEMAEKYQVSVIALGGQPSLLNNEYFVDNIKSTGINIQRSFYLFSIVDYDPSGWIIRDAFIRNLNFYRIKNVRVFDLINPDMLTPDKILFSRYKIPMETMAAKNAAWLKEIKKRKHKNQEYLIEGEELYGLEAESISTKRLTAALEEKMVQLLGKGKGEKLLQIYELKKLMQALNDLIIFKLTLG